MRADLLDHPGECENATLERFLEALSAYIKDAAPTDGPTWQWFALALVAATGYE